MHAAILTRHNAPLTLGDVSPMPLEHGQVLVRVVASGICGAQLQEIRGEKGGPLPHLLGHEGCGVVEEVGAGVRKMARGARVVMHWRKGAGCESDFPKYLYKKATMTSGLVTTFSEQSICSENRLTVVPDDTPPEVCALLGCSLSTALGTVETDADLKLGERVLVIGCGGLGMNLIRACAMRCAAEIAVLDLSEDKRQLAHHMGATQFYSVQGGAWLSAATLGKFDVILDTAGASFTMEQALPLLAPSGRYIMVGQPKPGESVTMTAARHMFEGEGKVIRATQGGGFNPATMIPRYLALHQSGQLNLDGVITHRLKLSEINKGIDLVRQGMAGRILIEP